MEEGMGDPQNTGLGLETPKCGERMETPKIRCWDWKPKMWGGVG